MPKRIADIMNINNPLTVPVFAIMGGIYSRIIVHLNLDRMDLKTNFNTREILNFLYLKYLEWEYD